MASPDRLTARAGGLPPNPEIPSSPRLLLIVLTETAPGAGVTTQAKLLTEEFNAQMVSAGGIKRQLLADSGQSSGITDETGLLQTIENDSPEDTRIIEHMLQAKIQQLADTGHTVIIVDTKNPECIIEDNFHALAIRYVLTANEDTRARRVHNRTTQGMTISAEVLKDVRTENAGRARTQLDRFIEAFPELNLPKTPEELHQFYVNQGYVEINANQSIDDVSETIIEDLYSKTQTDLVLMGILSPNKTSSIPSDNS